MIQIFDFDQGGEAWAQARCGIPTASRFADIMAKGEGKTRRKYLYELAGEIMTGEPAKGYTNAAMERGKVMEDEARDHYAFMKDVEPTRVGFVRNGDKGCSPDSLIGERKVLEIKTKEPHVLIEAIVRGSFPPEHKAQCQGALWVCERDVVDISCYWPKMPPLILSAGRDEEFIRNLADEVSRFNDDLRALVARLRGDTEELRAALKQSVAMAG
jgi:hypothetical protein